MAAPRKFSDAQRATIWALHEKQDLKPAEIARRCAAGLASVDPFQISRTGARDVIAAMERERGALPASLADIEHADVISAYPGQVVRIVKAETDRIEAKGKRGAPLTKADLEQLGRMAKIVRDLRQIRPPTRSTTNGNGEPGDFLKNLAREEQQRQREAKGTNG